MPQDRLATGAPTSDGLVDRSRAETVDDRPVTRTAIGAQQQLAQRPPFAPGELIDDFVVGEVLGEGGMGVVLSARDPDLDRAVAIKVLRRSVVAEVAPARARMLREAQAMARLSHPNVITVYRVGSVGDQLFIAMELVDGGTLRGWLTQPRSHAEIRDAFLAAGRGLSAAHAAGLIHRDFKSDNVLVGRDGRVRVTDFGLVATVTSPASPVEDPDTADDRSSAHLTHPGTILGTPAYMAPEQHAGRAVDARADQFAFCASLYEALYGVRPFAGETQEEIVANVLAGRIHEPQRSVVSPRLRALLLRGMAREPDHRFASMDELLDELVASGGDARLEPRLDRASPDPALRERIATLEARIEEARAAERRGEIERGLAVATAIAAEVDATRHGPLVAKHRFILGRLQSSVARIDEAIGSFRVAAAEAARADDAILEARALTELLSTVGEQRGDLHRTEDLELAASSAVTRAGSAPETVGFEIVAGAIDEQRERLDDARAHLEHALRLWQTSLSSDPVHHHLGGLIHGRLGSLVDTFGDLEAARVHYERSYDLFVAALGEQHPAVADALLNTGVLEMRLGNAAQAHALNVRALAIYRGAYGEHHERVAAALGNLGDSLIHLGRTDEAFEALEGAFAIGCALYRADSLERAGVLGTLAIAELAHGRAAAARPRLEESLAIRTAKLPAGHPGIAEAHGYLATALKLTGELDAAVTHYEAASRIYAAHAQDRELAMTEHDLAQLWGQRGHAELALQHLERADATWQRVDPDDRHATIVRFTYGFVLWNSGQRARAVELVRGLRGRDAEIDRWLVERGA